MIRTDLLWGAVVILARSDVALELKPGPGIRQVRSRWALMARRGRQREEDWLEAACAQVGPSPGHYLGTKMMIV